MSSSRLVLVAAVLVAFGSAAYGQNADMTAEPTSGDLLLLQALRGERSVGSTSVLPPRLSDLLRPATVLDTFRRYLVVYYAPLGDTVQSRWSMFSPRDGRFAVATMRDSIATLRVDASGYVRGGTLHWNANDPIGAGRLSVRAIGQIARNWSFVLDLANGVLFRGEPERIAVSDPEMWRAARLFTDQRSFYDRAIGAVQYEGSLGRIRIGRDAVGWGYSPLGGLLLSVAEPLFDHLLADVQYAGVRFSYVHGAVIGSDSAGNDVPTKFIAAHRLQFDPSDRLSIAVSDAVVYSGRGLDVGYLNPLGFYVSSGLASSERNERDNSLLALEAAWRPLDGTLVYGSLLADDISFGTLSDTSWRGNNNKYAWQLGLAQSVGTLALPALVVGEYVRINPFVYSHRTIVNAWTSQGEILGALQQPNSDRWTLAATVWLAPRLRFNLRADYIRWGENWLDSTGRIATAVVPGTTIAVPVGNVGGDASRGDGDVLPEPLAVGNRFLRGNVSHTRRVQAQVSLEPLVNVFVDIRAEYVHRTGGNAPMERWWWWVQLRVGY
ncbi:MAG: hypothetical protein N3B17_09140 [Chlorobi bacterium]|nr:hypothetical protein [Chlorobiota bacterium]